MSFLYWLSKFSQEAMLVELFLIGCVGVGYFGYLLTKKRRYGAAKNNIPDNVVRAFLIELITSAEGFKAQLFGETGGKLGANLTPEARAQLQASAGTMFSGATASVAQMAALANLNPADPQVAAAIAAAGGNPAAAAVAGGAATGDVSALQNQLTAAAQKQEELTKTVAQLTNEKAELEKKVAAGGAAAGGDAGKQLAELNDKIAKLEAKLSEYEVIEDDLANLKKFQQENKQLKAQLAALQGGAAPAAEAPAEAPAPAEAAPPTPAPAAEAAPAAAPAETSPLAAAEATVSETKAAESFDGIVDKVEESLAAPAPAGASATDPAIAQKVTQPVADAGAALDAATADKPVEPKPEKSDADLLNEFERMLSS